MTSENRILVAPKDIRSIGFHCPHCEATYFVPIEKIDRQIVRQCPNCQESIASDAAATQIEGPSDAKVLYGFVAFLRDMQNRPFGKCIRLELVGNETER